MHRLLVDMRFQRVVRIRQRGDFVSHVNHLSLAVLNQNALKASSSSVFCSISWAVWDPVEGLEEGERLTERNGPPRVMRSSCGARKFRAPMLAGSSCTQR